MKLIFSLFLITSLNSWGSQRVWIDYDVALGRMFRDPDDGLALIAAATSPELDVVGISFGFGNVNNLGFMEKQTRKILKKIGRTDIPFFRGAQNTNELGQETPASLALAEALKKAPLRIISLGRASNIANAITLHPEIKPFIQEVIVNYGRRLSTETPVGRKNLILPDTNVDGDFRAVKILIQNKMKITLIPTELMHDQIVDRWDMKNLRNGGHISKWVERKIKLWKLLWNIYPGLNGFIPWDVFVVGYLTRPQDFKCDLNTPISLRYLKNNTHKLFEKNKPASKYFVVTDPQLGDGTMGNYCYAVDSQHIDRWIQHWMKL